MPSSRMYSPNGHLPERIHASNIGRFIIIFSHTDAIVIREVFGMVITPLTAYNRHC